MTVEQLLKPRYKVVADYPGAVYVIGDIIKSDLSFISLYPHLQNYLFKITVNYVPYSIEDSRYLCLYDAAKTTSGETVVTPGYTGISGGSVVDVYWRHQSYAPLDGRFAIVYLNSKNYKPNNPIK